MRTFLEYMDFEDVKNLVFHILDPEEEMEDLIDMELGNFKNRDKLSDNPELSDLIASSENRGAVLSALKDDSTTVGVLLSLLT